jgi:hypothetical protein
VEVEQASRRTPPPDGSPCGHRPGTAGTAPPARRVEDVADPSPVADPHALGHLGGLHVVPLLELDDDGGDSGRSVVAPPPVIMASRRRELRGSWYSRRSPWSVKPPSARRPPAPEGSCATTAARRAGARSRYCSKKAARSVSAMRFCFGLLEEVRRGCPVVEFSGG